MAGRSSAVQRAFVKAREAEARRQHEIKVAESQVSKINQAKLLKNLHEGSARHQPGDRGRASSAKYQYDRLAVTRNQPRGQPGMRWGNVAQNRIDTVSYTHLTLPTSDLV